MTVIFEIPILTRFTCFKKISINPLCHWQTYKILSMRQPHGTPKRVCLTITTQMHFPYLTEEVTYYVSLPSAALAGLSGRVDTIME